MRNHNTLSRPQIIEEVAKCVPKTCKVDLENPEVFILIEVFKVRFLPEFIAALVTSTRCRAYVA